MQYTIVNLNYTMVFTVFLSLWVQILTGGIDIYVLSLDHPDEIHLLRHLLILELVVQLIEGIFYVWLAYSFKTVNNITPHRSMDWFFSTPTMLFTLCAYLLYLKIKKEIDEKTTSMSLASLSLSNIFTKENQSTMIVILILNALMLFFGYLGEMGVLSTPIAVGLGFVPFFVYYSMIYENFAKFTAEGTTLFWYFAIIWSIYGIVALLPYLWKNIGYNILDLFSKNFFGIFLAYLVWSKSIV